MTQFLFPLRCFWICLLLATALPAGAQSWDQVVTLAAEGRASGTTTGQRVALDAQGNRYIAGTFTGLIRFGTTTLISTYDPVTNHSSADAYVARLNANGTWAWAQRIGGNAFKELGALTVDTSGRIYLTGAFGDFATSTGLTATFGGTTLTSAGSLDVFVAQLSSSGAWNWVRQAGGPQLDRTTAMVVDANGPLYLGGEFNRSTANLPGNSVASFGAISLTSAGESDAFVAQLSPSGTWNWAQRAGGNQQDWVAAMALSNTGQLYLTGHFNSTSSVPASFGSITLTGAGRGDVFVAQLSSSGAWNWVQQGGGPSSDAPTNLVVDSRGLVYLAGYFDGDYGAQFGATWLTGAGRVDVFVAQLSPNGTWNWATAAGGAGADYVNQLAVDSRGQAHLTGTFGSEDNLTGLSINFGTTRLLRTSTVDLFIAQLSSSGVWNWAQKAGGFGYDRPTGLILDSSDQVYLAGYFGQLPAVAPPASATFGATTFSSAGGSDVFVAQLSPSGAWNWVQRAGGRGDDAPSALALDSNGQLHLLGSFTGAVADFGSGLLLSGEQLSCFAAVLNAATGAWQSSTAPNGGTGSKRVSHMVADSSGNRYVTGFFDGTVSFGTTTLTSAGSNDVFVAQLNPSGTWNWARRAGGTSDDQPSALAVDNSGHVYLAGFFASTNAQFGATTFNNPNSNYDGFVAQLSAGGTWDWARSAGGNQSDFFRAVAVDGNGQVYVAGSFGRTYTIGSTTLTSTGYTDVVVAQLSPSGAWNWVQRGGGIGGEAYPTAMKLGSSGQVYLTGYFDGTTMSLGGTTLSNAGNYDVFMAQLSPSGTWNGAQRAGGTGNDRPTALVVSSSGQAYLAGYFTGANATFGNTTLSSAGGSDVFVAQFDAAGTWDWAQRAGGVGSDRATALVLDNSGNIYLTGNFGSSVANFGPFSLAGNSRSNLFVSRLGTGGSWFWAQCPGGTGTTTADLLAVSNGSVHLAGTFTGPTVRFGTRSLSSNKSGPLLDAYVAWMNAADGTWQGASDISGGGGSQPTALLLDGTGQLNVAVSLEANRDVRFGQTQLPGGGPLFFDTVIGRMGTVLSARGGAIVSPAVLQVYPTVAKDTQLCYAYTGSLPAGAVLEVLDLKGQVVRSIPANARGTLFVASLPAGWYAVRLLAPGLHRVARFFRP